MGTMEARYLTSADVSRRLGVEGGTVRHYAEVLRELGFYMPKDEETGAYLWTPELVEVARTAYAMAKSTRGLSFREAVELILYAGELACHAKEGRSIVSLLREVLRLPVRLEEAVADVRDAGDDLRSVGEALRRELQGVVRDYRGELARSVVEVREVAREAREALGRASAGSWFGPIAFLVVAGAVFVPMLPLPVPVALVASLGLLGVGVYIGWRLAQAGV
jgi:hypothetical protein